MYSLTCEDTDTRTVLKVTYYPKYFRETPLQQEIGHDHNTNTRDTRVIRDQASV